MKEKIAFIAVGQAGGNIGQEFEKRGFHVLYINTSIEDLDTLENAQFKYHIPKGEGCNKDRKKAKELVIDDYDRIAAEVEAKIDAELIFVIFSSGGGTGSGAGPMLTDLLIDDGNSVGTITIIPGKKESVKAHINCYECFSELMEIKGSSACFILDNSKGDKLEINNEFVDTFCSFLEIPEKHTSVEGNIDKAEIMEVLKTHGAALMLKAKDKSGITDYVQRGIYAPMESDRAVKYIATSGNVDMDDLIKLFGMPVDCFQTFHNEEIICCASGMNFPLERLQEVANNVKDNKETITKNLSATMEAGLKDKINFLDNIGMPDKTKEAKPKSKRDILSKYL